MLEVPLMTQRQSHYGAVSRGRKASDFLSAATRVVWTLIVVALLAITVALFYPEVTRLSEMKRDLQKKTAHLAELRKSARERAEEVRLLQNDPEYLEIIARDRLDLMKEGETIFRLGGPVHKS